jgi:hypothetical protein
MSTRSPNKVLAGVKKGLKSKVAAKAPKPKPPTKKELAAAKAKEEKRLLRRQETFVKACVDDTQELRSTLADHDFNSKLQISPGKYSTIQHRQEEEADDIVAYDQISDITPTEVQATASRYSFFKDKSHESEANPYTIVRNSNLDSRTAGYMKKRKSIVVARSINSTKPDNDMM